jgi:hypothetical protein
LENLPNFLDSSALWLKPLYGRNGTNTLKIPRAEARAEKRKPESHCVTK